MILHPHVKKYHLTAPTLKLKEIMIVSDEPTYDTSLESY